MKKDIETILHRSLEADGGGAIIGFNYATNKIAEYIEKNYKPIIPGTDRKYTYKEFKELCNRWEIGYWGMLQGWKAYKEGKDLNYFRGLHSKTATVFAKKEGNKCCNYIPEVCITID